MSVCVTGIIMPHGSQKKVTWEISNQKDTGATVTVSELANSTMDVHQNPCVYQLIPG